MKPILDNVMISPLDEPVSTFLLTQKEAKPCKGEVLAVGKDCKEVKPGQKIVFNKHRAHHVKVKDIMVMFIKEEDIDTIYE